MTEISSFLLSRFQINVRRWNHVYAQVIGVSLIRVSQLLVAWRNISSSGSTFDPRVFIAVDLTGGHEHEVACQNVPHRLSKYKSYQPEDGSALLLGRLHSPNVRAKRLRFHHNAAVGWTLLELSPFLWDQLFYLTKAWNGIALQQTAFVQKWSLRSFKACFFMFSDLKQAAEPWWASQPSSPTQESRRPTATLAVGSFVKIFTHRIWCEHYVCVCGNGWVTGDWFKIWRYGGASEINLYNDYFSVSTVEKLQRIQHCSQKKVYFVHDPRFNHSYFQQQNSDSQYSHDRQGHLGSATSHSEQNCCDCSRKYAQLSSLFLTGVGYD